MWKYYANLVKKRRNKRQLRIRIVNDEHYLFNETNKTSRLSLTNKSIKHLIQTLDELIIRFIFVCFRHFWKSNKTLQKQLYNDH